MDNIPDCPTMMFDLFRERQRLPHQAADPLPERVVQALDMACLAAFLAYRTLPFRRQHAGVRIPAIAGTDRTLAIHGGQRLPALVRGCFITSSDCDPDHVARVTVTGQPHPRFVACMAHKRPAFVTCDGQPAFFLDRTCTWRGWSAYVALTDDCNQRSDTPTARAMPARDMRSRKRRSLRAFVSSGMRRSGGSPTN